MKYICSPCADKHGLHDEEIHSCTEGVCDVCRHVKQVCTFKSFEAKQKLKQLFTTTKTK
jgi:hypothetical protein